MKHGRRWLSCGLALVVAFAGALQAAEEDRPFEKDDPEVQSIKELDFESVVYKNEPRRTRVMALVALNELLNRVGQRSKARLEMLEQFLGNKELMDDLEKSEVPVPETERLTFEDGKKIAIAFVKTEKGAAMFGDRVPKVSDAGLRAYETSYLKLGRKRWADVAYSRHMVEGAAVFLSSIGRFKEYLKWAKGEALRQKRDAEATYHERVKQEAIERKERQAEARERAHEKELKRMDYAFRLKESKLNAAASIGSANRNWNRWGGHYSDVYVPRGRGRVVKRTGGRRPSGGRPSRGRPGGRR